MGLITSLPSEIRLANIGDTVTETGDAAYVVGHSGTTTVNFDDSVISLYSSAGGAFAPGVALPAFDFNVTVGTFTVTAVGEGSTTLEFVSQDTSVAPTISIPVTVGAVDDESYLNKRGLTHFWENIDDIKQDKLTAGAGISITGNTISATGGGTADAVDWGNITGSMSNQTDLTTALNAKANSADLATVATSGSYNDLTNKPTIPTVNNATLTIQKNGTTVKTFTANANSNVTANITVPTKTSDLTNDSGYLTTVAWGDVTGKPTFATVATSGSYNDLSNKPTIPAAQVNSDWNAASGVAQILNKPTLATVATSGSYNDLTDTPTIPSGVALYTGLGENTDGALTQKATRELFYNDSARSKMKIGVLGYSSDTFGNHSTSIGDLSRAGAIESTALGYNARTTGDYSIAIGSSASIGSRARASVIGYMSSARAADAVALGSYALATRANEVNIGTAMGGSGYDNTQTRLLGGLHAGLLDTDAVNVGQLNSALADKADVSDLASKQNLLSPGSHIDITSDVISATGYVHSENPQAAAAASSTITGSMIANGTITADKLASGATVKLTMSTSDIGEGAPLAANTLYGVYI